MLNDHDFPTALREIPSWGAWKLGQRVDKTGVPQLAKLMCDGLGRVFTLNDLKTRLYRFPPLLEAWNAGRLDAACRGLAFRFEDEHGLLFVDLDGVRNPVSGELHLRAEALVKAFPSWCEISQSGRGLHLVYRRSGPWRNGTRAVREIKVEAYSGRRFAALTGDRLNGTPGEIGNIDNAEFASFAGIDVVTHQVVAGDIADLPPGLMPEAELVRVVSRIWPGIDRGQWISTLFALRHASGGSQEGLKVALAWSAGNYSERGAPANHKPEADARAIIDLWHSGEQRRSGEPRATSATLYKRAGVPMPPALARLFQPLAPDFGNSDIATDWDEIATALANTPVPELIPSEPVTQPVIDAAGQVVADIVAAAVKLAETTFAPWVCADEDGRFALVKTLLGRPFRVLVAVTGSSAAEGLAEVLRVDGVNALTLYGRTSPGMCRRVDVVRSAHRLGLEGVGNAFCADGQGNMCPHAPTCPLIESWRGIIDADVVITLKQRITTQLGLLEGKAWETVAMGDRAIVTLFDGKTVIDNLVEHDSIGAAELDIATRLKIGPAYADVMRAAHAALAADPPPIHQAIRARLGNAPAQLLDKAEGEVQARTLLKVNPRMNDQELGEAFTRRNLPPFFPRTVLLIKALHGNPGQLDVEDGRIHIAARRKAVLEPGRLGDRRIVTYGSEDPALRRRVGDWIGQPVATPPRLATPQASDAPILFQAVEKEMTLARWRDGDSANQHTLDLLLRAMSLRYGRVGLVAHQEVLDYVGWRPAAPFESEHRLTDVDAVLIGGRFRPRLSRLYRQAACFDPKLPPFSSLPVDAPITEPTEREIVDRDGNAHRYLVHRSAQTVVAEETDMVEQTTQAATLDSVRFSGERQKAVVIVLSTAPAPGYAPDRVVSWANLFGTDRHRHRLLALLIRLDGVLPLKPAMLGAFARDALPTKKMVERFLAAVEAGPLAVKHPAWLYRRVSIETMRSQGRHGAPVEAITCLNDLEQARTNLRKQYESWLVDPEQKQFYADLAAWSRLVD